MNGSENGTSEEPIRQFINYRRAGMSVAIRVVKSRKDLRVFIHLPAKIHRNHSRWVPPIYAEEWKYFNPNKNKAFDHSETVLALAYRKNKGVGRIMGIINHRYNTYCKEKIGRFGYLECEDDLEVAQALLSFIENWARERNMHRCVGPMGFSDQDPEGFLIEGFTHEPTLSTYYNHDYMPRILEMSGYKKEVDYVVYKVDVPQKVPDLFQRISKRIEKNRDYAVIEFSKRKQIKPYIRPIFQLMNDTFKDNYGYFPLELEEMDNLGKKYLPVVDPNFIKVITKNKEVVAFTIGIPNMAPGIRKAKGRLFPLGLFKIIRAAKETKQLDLYLGGIRENCRGKGLDGMIGAMLIESSHRAGIEFWDSHHELESNLKMRAEMERLGGKVYKRYRIFQKRLKPNT